MQLPKCPKEFCPPFFRGEGGTTFKGEMSAQIKVAVSREVFKMFV